MKLIVPMKAHIGSEKDLERKDVIFEPKLDGIRAVCYLNKELAFFSRNNRNITHEYPEFTFRSLIQARSAVLDGEIIVLDPELNPRFSLWQQGHEAMYIVFDILMFNGKLLLDMPLIKRKELLEKVITPGPTLDKIFYTDKGEALWHEMLKRNMEGVIAKETESLYYPGIRSRVWLKIKAYKTCEAVIIGYTQRRRAIASLALGIYDQKGTLHYIGKVGTGFSMAFLKDLLEKLKKLEKPEPEIQTKEKKIIWLKPMLVCEIKYLEFTHAGIVRSPVFLRLRPDKNPQEITFKDQQLNNRK